MCMHVMMCEYVYYRVCKCEGVCEHVCVCMNVYVRECDYVWRVFECVCESMCKCA